MQSICSYLLEVEGRIFNALFSTAPKLANNESDNCNNTKLSDSLEEIFQNKYQINGYNPDEFASYPYQAFLKTACGLEFQQFANSGENDKISLKTLGNLYDRCLLTPVEYWTIAGLLHFFAVRQNNSEKFLSEIQKSFNISSGIQELFCNIATESDWLYEVNGKELLIDKQYCSKLDSLLVRLLGRSLSEIKTLDGLSSVLYQHPADSAVLRKLEAIPGMGTVCENIINVAKRYTEIGLISNWQRVTPNSHPRLFKLFWTAAQILDLKTLPELYIDGSMNVLNAYTNGSDEKAFIVLSSRIVYQFDERELLYVIGHEMGHIQCGHVKYGMLAEILCHGAASIPILGPIVQGLATSSVEPLLALWSRYREFSCDRAGLLCCQNREAALRAFVKLAGQPWDQYNSIRTRTLVDQTLMFEKLTNGVNVDKAFSLFQVLYADHPFIIYRASELLKWIADGTYEDIVKNDASGREALIDALKQEAQLKAVYKVVENTLIAWHLENYPALRLRQVRRDVRRILYELRPAESSPLSDLFEINLRVTEERVDTYKYLLQFKTISNNQPVKLETQLNMPDASYDAVPSLIRKELTRTGSNTIDMTLYKIQ